MINPEWTRTAMLLGEAGIDRLQQSRVAVIGLGGVGGHCAEALARVGVGALLLVDADIVDATNLNRQLVATKRTIGMPKAQALAQRIEEISDCRVDALRLFVGEDTIDAVFTDKLDFVVDAVDTVSAKLALIRAANARHIPLISCMGAGNRLDPSRLSVTDIYKTEGCPLARAVRKGCREMDIKALPVVVSDEQPAHAPETAAQRTPGSSPFVPAAAGLLLASYVTRALVGLTGQT